jgi:hypothetical protein
MTAVASPLSELVRFLIARVDEDEEELRRLQRTEVRGSAKADLGGIRSIARQRAECSAKRNVIRHAQQLLALRDLPSEKAVRDAAGQMLHAMAEPYSGHYGYREEWGRHR